MELEPESDQRVTGLILLEDFITNRTRRKHLRRILMMNERRLPTLPGRGFGIELENGAFAVTVNSKCAPTCEGVTESGTAVIDPSSCLGYYVCAYIGGEFVLSDRLECNEGYYFNTDLVPPQCDQIAGAHEGFCDGYCNPCEAHCTEPSTLRPDPLNCTRYYLCLDNNVATPFPCDASVPYFDYIAEECQSDVSKCYDYCDSSATYCTETGFVVPANTTCAQQYSYCDPPTLIPFSCEVGECFNVNDEICE